jgi:hypothetical protein
VAAHTGCGGTHGWRRRRTRAAVAHCLTAAHWAHRGGGGAHGLRRRRAVGCVRESTLQQMKEVTSAASSIIHSRPSLYCILVEQKRPSGFEPRFGPPCLFKKQKRKHADKEKVLAPLYAVICLKKARARLRTLLVVGGTAQRPPVWHQEGPQQPLV